MSKHTEPEYTTPDQYRLAHKRWQRAKDNYDDAVLASETAKQEERNAAAALADVSMEMQDATGGLARYIVDEQDA